MTIDPFTGYATLALAAVTAIAVIVSVVLSNRDRSDRTNREKAQAAADAERDRQTRIATVRELIVIVRFFQLRMGTLKKETITDLQALSRGCDAYLAAALSNAVLRTLPSAVAEQIYEALFEASGVLAQAVRRQEAGMRSNRAALIEIESLATAAEVKLTQAIVELRTHLTKLGADATE